MAAAEPVAAVVDAGELWKWRLLTATGRAPSVRAVVAIARAGDLQAAAVAPAPEVAGAPTTTTTTAWPAHVLLVPLPALLDPGCEWARGGGGSAVAREDPEMQCGGRPDGLFTLLFTSGTSGAPKGVMVSGDTWRRDIGDGPGTRAWPHPHVVASFVPLSHSSDRLRCWDAIGRGGRIGFAHYGADNWLEHQRGGKKGGLLTEGAAGSSNGVEALVEDLAALRPSALALPPRIWAGLRWLWADVHASTATGGGGGGGGDGWGSARDILRASGSLGGALGGRVGAIATGGAAHDPAVIAWALTQFPPGTPFQESYGCTECGAITENGAVMSAATGRGAELRLEPLPPGAAAAGFPPPRFGEAVVRTPTMATGYWRDASATAAAFCADGFWRTGDILEALGDGRYAVRERVRALLELRGGAGIVSPAALEARLLAAAAGGGDAPALEHVAIVQLADARGGGIALGVSLRGGGRGGDVAACAWVGGVAGCGDGGGGGCGDAAAARVLEWARAVIVGAPGVPRAAAPAALVALPRTQWACGALLNVQHKVARAAVARAVEEALAAAAGTGRGGGSGEAGGVRAGV